MTGEYWLNVHEKADPRKPCGEPKREAEIFTSELEAREDAAEGWPGWRYDHTIHSVFHTDQWHPSEVDFGVRVT